MSMALVGVQGGHSESVLAWDAALEDSIAAAIETYIADFPPPSGSVVLDDARKYASDLRASAEARRDLMPAGEHHLEPVLSRDGYLGDDDLERRYVEIAIEFRVRDDLSPKMRAALEKYLRGVPARLRPQPVGVSR